MPKFGATTSRVGPNVALLALLMLGPLGFAPWQYGLAFAVPCIGGLVGSRLSRPLAARYGTAAVLRVSGRWRAVFGPVCATYRLQAVDGDHVARVLTAWSVAASATRAVVILAWGLLADAVGPRWALAAAGALLLVTPFLLPRADPDLDGPGTGDRAARNPSTGNSTTRRAS